MDPEATVESTYAELSRKAVGEIRALGQEHCLGFCSQLTTFWEEFKYQVQREESIAFELCENTVRLICRCLIQNLDRDQQTLLWQDNLAAFDWPEEDGIPFGDPVEEALENELYARVYWIASDEELAADPDEERDRERLEEDSELSERMLFGEDE